MASEQFDFTLPKELIASAPAEPRDAARLFVYDTRTDTITFDTFHHIKKYIPKDALLVLNTSKVVPARIEVHKETGGKVELLLLVNELRVGETIIKSIADRKLTVGQKLSFPNGEKLEVVQQEEQFFYMKPLFPIEHIGELLMRYGITPIPKYLGESPLTETELRARYQSVFATQPASVAAPTASLHFTPELLEELRERGNSFASIALHVGMGTFAPVREEQIREGKLHREQYTIPKETSEILRLQKHAKKPIVAVGTTVMRALESAGTTILSNGALTPIIDSTEIFIRYPHHFMLADMMVTNFHIPQSSLMSLVDAFLRDKNAKRTILELYAIAIKERFHFYSFGDAMLIV
ncbi:MAG: tRNA preQ1(34) S-adenosylmethionine ribosyltransferase-isomerase QueA [Candidatus Paceibacterota bacterium]|jgi:S-adenosylmethionine:tRNA ribosyltransferase-isomerase